jgi:hypothetical protein
MGFSLEHSSLVGLVCNLVTEYISPQYHMVFDELFTTVHSAVQDRIQQDQFPWLELFVQHQEFFGPESHEESGTITYTPIINFIPNSKLLSYSTQIILHPTKHHKLLP